MIKIIPGLLLVLSSLTFSLPVSAVEVDTTNEKRNYCNRWAYRFLTLKNGKNFTPDLFYTYVGICEEHYVELRNYYKNLNKKVNNIYHHQTHLSHHFE